MDNLLILHDIARFRRVARPMLWLLLIVATFSLLSGCIVPGPLTQEERALYSPEIVVSSVSPPFGILGRTFAQRDDVRFTVSDKNGEPAAVMDAILYRLTGPSSDAAVRMPTLTQDPFEPTRYSVAFVDVSLCAQIGSGVMTALVSDTSIGVYDNVKGAYVTGGNTDQISWVLECTGQ